MSETLPIDWSRVVTVSPDSGTVVINLGKYGRRISGDTVTLKSVNGEQKYDASVQEFPIDRETVGDWVRKPVWAAAVFRAVAPGSYRVEGTSRDITVVAGTGNLSIAS